MAKGTNNLGNKNTLGKAPIFIPAVILINAKVVRQ